jgi:trigger factor
MQIALETKAALKRAITVTLPAGQLDQAIAARLKNAAQNVDLKGFRKGKVPMQLITQRFGQQIRSEATEELIRSSLGPAMDQQKLRIAAAPTITAMNDDASGFIYTAEFEVLPELGELNVANLELVKETAEILDTDIERMIETLRLQRRAWIDAHRAAISEDLVSFEFSIIVDGRRLPEQGAERAATIIGSNATLPGLEDALLGANEGDEKSATVSFPSDYNDNSLAGKAGVAQVKVLKVQLPKLPPVDAQFVQSFGVAEGSIEAFHREIRANLDRELKAALSARLRQHISDKLVTTFDGFDLPESLVEDDARAIRGQAVENARRQGATITQEPELAPFIDQAKRRVRAGMVLNELARKHEIKLDQKRVIEALTAIASTYEDPREVMNMYRNDRNMMAGLQGRVMEEQVADWIAEQAKTTLVTKAFSDVISR